MTSSGNSGLRIFAMGNSGYMSAVLRDLISRKENVVGLCARKEPSRPVLRAKRALRSILFKTGLYARDLFELADPFEIFEQPIGMAGAAGIPVFEASKIKTAEFETRLRGLKADLILVAGFNRLIPPNIIAAAKVAAINFHPSLLPKHRGGTPNRWVIRNGEGKSGVTVHFIEEEFDTGAIIAQEVLEVMPGDTWGELEARIARKMVDMAAPVIKAAAEGRLKGVPQDHAKATYEPSMKGEHLNIDWREPADAIKRLCYARRPKSGAMASISGRRLCIWDGEVIDSAVSGRGAGTIVDFDRAGSPVVECGRGLFKIEYLLHGGRIVKSSRVMRKRSVRKGMVFDR